MLFPPSLGEPEFRDERPLLDNTGKPNTELFRIFLNPDDHGQQELFRRIKLSGNAKAIESYTSACTAVVISQSEEPAKKAKALTSLKSFVNSANEGILKFTTASRDLLGSNYYRILDELSTFFQNGQAPIDELRRILIALAEMDFFRVKKTLMLSFISYEYPEDSEWFIKRLRLLRRELFYKDNEMALYAFSFVVHTAQELQNILDNPKTSKDSKDALLEIISLINAEVPSWLLCSDWRVVANAILYCGIAKLTDNREILEQLVLLAKDERLRNMAEQILLNLDT